MRVLIVGGTRFIGRRIAAELMARGDDVIVVHRGESEPAELGGCTHLHADRSALAGRSGQLRALRPDAVIDTRAMTKADAEAALPHLPDAHLVLLSSIDVYPASSCCWPARAASRYRSPRSRRSARAGIRSAGCCPAWAITTTSSTWSRITSPAAAPSCGWR